MSLEVRRTLSRKFSEGSGTHVRFVQSVHLLLSCLISSRYSVKGCRGLRRTGVPFMWAALLPVRPDSYPLHPYPLS